MSTVVGLKTKNGVWIGADSRASTEEGEIRPFIAEKMFYNSHYLIAFIGSVRCGQLLRPEYFTPPDDIFELPNAVIEQLETNKSLPINEHQIAMMHTNYLIGDMRNNKLYEILADFQLNEIIDITSIGSGSYYAFGSLHASRELNINDVHKRVELALKAAAEFDSATGGPFIITKLGENIGKRIK